MKSVEYFNQAIELDSTYALAIAGLADAYFILSFWEWLPQNEGFKLSKTFAEKAILLDDQLSEAHAVLGGLLTYHKKNYNESEKELRLAIELNPGYATAHQYYAELLTIMNRRDEARKEIDLALMYNPLSLIMHNISGWYYYGDGFYEEALKEGLLIREIDETNLLPSWLIIYSYLHLGRYDEFVSELQVQIPLETQDPTDAAEIRNIYDSSGIDGTIRWLIDYGANKSEPDPAGLARLNIAIDEEDEAVKWLEFGFENNDKYIRSDIKYIHEFQSLGSHPGFIALVEKLEAKEK